MTPTESELLRELFTQKNYKPRTEKHRYRSFNAHFKDWLFKLKPFAQSFNIFYGKLFPSSIESERNAVLDRALYHYGESAYADFARYLDGLNERCLKTVSDGLS